MSARSRNRLGSRAYVSPLSLVVSSRIKRPGLFYSSMQHGGRDGEDRRRADGHSRDISPHLARARGLLREPARPTRTVCPERYRTIREHLTHAGKCPLKTKDFGLPKQWPRTWPRRKKTINPRPTKLPWAHRCLPPLELLLRRSPPRVVVSHHAFVHR